MILEARFSNRKYSLPMSSNPESECIFFIKEEDTRLILPVGQKKEQTTLPCLKNSFHFPPLSHDGNDSLQRRSMRGLTALALI